MIRRSPCNLCNSEEAVILGRQNSFVLNKCRKCGLVYVYPQPSKDEISSHYSVRYNPLPVPSNNNFNKSKGMLQTVEEKIQKGRLLDVGCSYGFFLNTARNNGWEVKGVEIAKGPAQYAMNLNIAIVEKELIDADFSEGEFDVITMWHVLEHFRDPFTNLLVANNILKKKGFLFLTTPNINSLVAKLCGKYWSWLDPPTHLYYYSSKTIVKLLEKAGFNCLYVKTREGDGGNPLYRILRSTAMRFYPHDSIQKDNKSPKADYSTSANNTIVFFKNLIKGVADLMYIVFRPVFWIFLRFHCGAEIFVCAQKR